MPKMIIRGADPRLDGEYDVKMPPWTKREWYLVKKQTGVIASDFVASEDGQTQYDLNLLTAIGLVALHRADKDALFPLFWETADDQVEFDFSDEAVDDSPPAQTPTGSPANTPASSEPSGGGSNGSGELSDASLSPTGTPRSDTGSTSDRETSAT
jgi:hypothetical protein